MAMSLNVLQTILWVESTLLRIARQGRCAMGSKDLYRHLLGRRGFGAPSPCCALLAPGRVCDVRARDGKIRLYPRHGRTDGALFLPRRPASPRGRRSVAQAGCRAPTPLSFLPAGAARP